MRKKVLIKVAAKGDWNLFPTRHAHHGYRFGLVQLPEPKLASLPNHQRWHAKMEAQSEHVGIAYTFFLTFGPDLQRSVRAY